MVSVIRPLVADDDAIGGKARSLTRLRALGLPVPAGFAVATSLSRALRGVGPKPPLQLRTAADLARLEAARVALAAATLPADVARELDAAVAALCAAAPFEDASPTFAVRSSGAREDSADGAAPGIFESFVRVAPSDVPTAVALVLASALTPAAWRYGFRGDEDETGDLAVLVHRFVDGTAAGAASGTSRADDAGTDVRIDAQAGTPTEGARAKIVAAVVSATARFGPAEIEWTARGDDVTFLQLRPYRDARPADTSASRANDADPSGSNAAVRDAEREGWTWDAAHNPGPLSPAQAGLVALVDAHAQIGLRQRVIAGYLFFRRSDGVVAPGGDARAAFARLAADVDAGLAALGPTPRLAAALDFYVAMYARLFGVVQPACATARAALGSFVATHVPDAAASWSRLTEGVASAATQRATLARAIATALPDSDDRQAAVDAYLATYGDESARWDVSEPTLGEAPERLLFVGAGPNSGGESDGDSENAPADNGHGLPSPTAQAILRRLPEDKQREFQATLAAAREAAAVAEDDDALFAQLQALVRRSLLALGQRLVADQRLRRAEDVFFLPLTLARELDAAPAATTPAITPSTATTDATTTDASTTTLASTGDAIRDLDAIVALARKAWSDAVAAPPWPPLASTTSAVVRGARGSAGRAIGRVVHHPSSVPVDARTILIAATLLPTELPLLYPAAIVVETGTVLGHVAAQARERGIPAVVGAVGARAAVRAGALVVVDGDRGEVILLDEDAPPQDFPASRR